MNKKKRKQIKHECAEFTDSRERWYLAEVKRNSGS